MRPLLPILLARGARSATEIALVDSGADACILPHWLGLRLGLDWNRQPLLPSAGGAYCSTPSRGVVLEGTIAPFQPVRLTFLWVQSDDVPLILGQGNFFLEFDVCFFRSRDVFQIQPRTP